MKHTKALLLSLIAGFVLAVQPAYAADPDTAAPEATNTAPAAGIQLEDGQAKTNANPGEVMEEMQEVSRHHRRGHDPVVVFGRDVEIKAGQEVEAVIVIGGSAKIRGKVTEAVVVIGGDAEIEGEVGDAVVVVLGSGKVAKGAKISGDFVVVGGTAETEEGATVEGHTQEVPFAGFLPEVEWLKAWFKQCVLKMRPLAPQVGWVWGVAGVFFLLYLLAAAVFPQPIRSCVDELTRRPITTFLLGLLTEFLFPVIMIILIATGVGLIVVPFALAALVLGAIVGKVALLEWLGMRVGAGFGTAALQKPLLALVAGTIVICLLYMVPFLGLLTFGIVGTWGLGGAVSAAFSGLKRELPEKPAPQPAPLPSTEQGPLSMPGLASGPAVGFAESAGVPLTQPTQPAQPTQLAVAVPEALAHRRAGFWERMGAAFLDIILVGILGAIVQGPPLAFLVALAYFAGMWGWKGTTIGGIVLGLKIVRMDGQEVTFLVAFVRALAAAFSIVCLFLGFLWIAWDSEKQGWHDKIAGTYVLRLPRGTPLI